MERLGIEKKFNARRTKGIDKTSLFPRLSGCLCKFVSLISVQLQRLTKITFIALTRIQ